MVAQEGMLLLIESQRNLAINKRLIILRVQEHPQFNLSRM